MKHTMKLATCLLLLTLLLSACKQAPKEITLTDREGQPFVLPAQTEKLISLAPSITQVLLDLGLEDKLTAVDTYSAKLLPEGHGLPVLDMMKPDAEVLAKLEADLIFATGMSKVDGEDPLKLLKDMGAVVTYIPTSNSLDAIGKDVLFIAEAAGQKDKGQALVDDMNKVLDEYREKAKAITEKKTVYFEIGAAPNMYSFGTGVFLHEVIELLGATNALASETSWILVGAEAVVAANPSVILTNVDYLDDPVSEIMSRPGFDTLDAVKNKAVFAIDKASSSYSNHHIVKALQEMATAIYPEVYGK